MFSWLLVLARAQAGKAASTHPRAHLSKGP
jgi:hypothetical protein